MIIDRRRFDRLVHVLAYELADATIDGPTVPAMANNEARLLEADERHNGAILRLARRMGICCICGEPEIPEGSRATICPACWEVFRVEAARGEMEVVQ